jgi:hypothetical protein
MKPAALPICVRMLGNGAGNTIHRWRIVRQRIFVFAGVATAVAIAVSLYYHPEEPMVIPFGVMAWGLLYYLLRPRLYATQLARSQRRFGKLGINWVLSERRQVLTMFRFQFAATLITLPLIIISARHHEVPRFLEIIWTILMVPLFLSYAVWYMRTVREQKGKGNQRVSGRGDR